MLETSLLDLFVRELTRLLQETTGAGRSGRGGSIAFLQHFGSTLNLHVHFHLLALDGIYVPSEDPDGPPRFVRAPAPTREQVERLCERVATWARQLVDRRPGPEAEEEATLPVFKLVGAEPADPVEPRLHARVDWFDLHACAASRLPGLPTLRGQERVWSASAAVRCADPSRPGA